MTIFLLPTYVAAKQSTPIEKLDNISDEALQMVKSERYDDAKKLLDYFTVQFSKLANRERPLTLDQLRIVNVSRNEAVEATVSPTMKQEERINRLTKFRLVIDALTTTKSPLWVEMKNPVLNDIRQAEEAAKKRNSSEFNSSYNSFLSLYNVIYPSLKIDLSTETIQQLDTRINYVDDYRLQVLSDSKKTMELTRIENELKRIFDSQEADQSDPSIWWVIFSTGSIIIMTLSYVGFRKYQGEKALRMNRSRKFKN